MGGFGGSSKGGGIGIGTFGVAGTKSSFPLFAIKRGDRLVGGFLGFAAVASTPRGCPATVSFAAFGCTATMSWAVSLSFTPFDIWGLAAFFSLFDIRRGDRLVGGILRGTFVPIFLPVMKCRKKLREPDVEEMK